MLMIIFIAIILINVTFVISMAITFIIRVKSLKVMATTKPLSPTQTQVMHRNVKQLNLVSGNADHHSMVLVAQS